MFMEVSLKIKKDIFELKGFYQNSKYNKWKWYLIAPSRREGLESLIEFATSGKKL